MFICPKCEEPYYKKDLLTKTKCPICNIKVEDLTKYYDKNKKYNKVKNPTLLAIIIYIAIFVIVSVGYKFLYEKIITTKVSKPQISIQQNTQTTKPFLTI